MKSISKQLIVICIIFLLVGVSYTSAIRVENKSSIVDNQVEDDCGCNEVSSTHLNYLKRQLNRIDIYGKLLLVLSQHNPELKEISKEVVNEINSLNVHIDKLTNQPFPIICDILLKLSNHLATVEDYFF